MSKVLEFYSMQENMGKTQISKYGQKLFDRTKTAATDAPKTVSKMATKKQQKQEVI